MVRFSAPALGVALFVFTLSIALVQGQGCGTDGQACLINQWKECSSNVLHTAFILDRSLSMEWGTHCDQGAYCPKVHTPQCAVNIQPPENRGALRQGCQRSMVMRIVLRLVLKKLFNKYARGCYEYLQSNSYRATGLSCVQVGHTTTIFHLIWWWSDYSQTIVQDFEQFTKGSGSQWSKELDAYLFKSNGDRRDERWVRVNGEFKIKDDAVNEFFDEIFLKNRVGTYPASYPIGAGYTYPDIGINKYVGILKNEILPDLNENQLENTEFPVFLMTDGLLSRPLSQKTRDTSDELRSLSSNVKTYGLGLSSSASLTGSQKKLYTDTGYIWETPLANGEKVEHFFSDQESANKIVDAIISRIDTCDTICYQPQGREKQCTKEGGPVPTWEGINDAQTEPPEVTDDPVTGDDDETGEPVQRMPNEDLFVKFLGSSKVYKIEASTVLCKSKTTNGYEFVEYEDDGTCKCCAKLEYQKGDGKCLCDFRADDGLGESIEPVGTKQVGRSVKTFNSGSALSKELAEGGTVFEVGTVDDAVAEESGGSVGGVIPGSGKSGDTTTPPSTRTGMATPPPAGTDPVSGSPALSLLALLPALLLCALQALD